MNKALLGKYTPSSVASALGMSQSSSDGSAGVASSSTVGVNSFVEQQRRAQLDEPNDDERNGNDDNVNDPDPDDDENNRDPDPDDDANNSDPEPDDDANNDPDPDDDATNNSAGGASSDNGNGDDNYAPTGGSDDEQQGEGSSDNDQGSDDDERGPTRFGGYQGMNQRGGPPPGFGPGTGMLGPGVGGVGGPMGGRPGVSTIGNPVRYNRIQGAGTKLAREGRPRDMDRWKNEVEDRRKSIGQRQKGLRSFSSSSSVRPVNGRLPEGKASDLATMAMRANTPGTKEYNERKQKIMQRIDLARKRRNPVATETLKMTPSGTTPILKKEALPYQKDIKRPGFVQKQVEKIPLVKRIVKMTPEEELILDASLSFIHALKYGVFTSDAELTAEKKSALKNWLNLLSVSLPPEWALHKLIDKLIRRFSVISKSDAALERVLAEYELPRKFWSNGCKRKGGVGGGFSCGFWKLLHIVTVGVAEHKGGYNLVEAEMVGAETQTFSPIDAADTIREYIGHFFTCAECREHFVKTYDDCSKNRRCARLTEETEFATDADWKELALWLWEVHNDVSVRLLVERHTKRATKYSSKGLQASDEVTALWPDLDGCLMCFAEDGTWDEPEVFRMLERTYWYVGSFTHFTFKDSLWRLRINCCSSYFLSLLIRPDADLDPMSDKLLTFVGGEQRYGLGLLWIVMFAGLYFVYSLVSGNSVTIQRSLFTARQIVATGGGTKKKIRSV